MADVMCIVSKAVFEKAAGKSPKVGDQLRMDRYVTANKALEPVRAGGKLYLVTVRPPDESLWLVAVLENPKHDGTQWIAKPAATPITDISSLRAKIKFESGKGISADKGTLGMSLQTPRVLAAADTKLIDAMLGIATPDAPPPPIGTTEGIPAAPGARNANTGERRQGDALLQAVLDDPISEAPRQVYADAMQARNDPRGELIVIELALAGPLSIRKRELLTKRRDELLKAHGKTWFPYSVPYRLTGGFVSMVGASLTKLLKATDVFDQQPIVEVHVTDVSEANAAKLIKAPWLARVRHLVIKGRLGDKHFASLVASPQAQQLAELNIIGCGVTDKGLAALGTRLPACRTLVLTKNSIKDAGLDALRTWAHLAELETLYLSNCGLTTKGLAKLLGTKLPKLAKLTLSHNALDDSIGDVLATCAPNLPGLHHLELVGAKLTPKVIDSLGKAKLAQIRRVDVRKNRIKEQDVAGMPVFRGGLQ